MRDEQGIRRGFTIRRFAFAFGAVGLAYYTYTGDLVGAICFGAISAVALISKAISMRKKARDRAGE
jgi:hypothetical protein